MVPTSDSELACWSKVSVVQLQRMSMHERLRAATLLWPFQARTRDACLKCSLVAPCGVAWVRQSPCGIAAVPRGARRASTSVEKGSFQRFLANSTDLQVESARHQWTKTRWRCQDRSPKTPMPIYETRKLCRQKPDSLARGVQVQSHTLMAAVTVMIRELRISSARLGSHAPWRHACGRAALAV